MPDYFVPIDTTLYTDYHRNLVAKGAVIKFTMKFIEGHRKELANKYKKFESFNEKFIIDDDMLATLREMGEIGDRCGDRLRNNLSPPETSMNKAFDYRR